MRRVSVGFGVLIRGQWSGGSRATSQQHCTPLPPIFCCTGFGR